MKVAMIYLSVLVWAMVLISVQGHGRLAQPAGRATLWRMGYEGSVINYDDTQLFCGGFERQYTTNGGKCGICGDPWDATVPREHEDGGTYGRGIITGRYEQGSVIEIVVEITAHHRGYFEFKLCPVTAEDQVSDQECLDRHPLQLVDSQSNRYYLPEGSKAGLYPIKAKLPQDLTCQRCVLQWHYFTANRWGDCSNGTSAVGCGPQETFRGCADVQINPVKEEDVITTAIPDNQEKSKAIPETEISFKSVIPEKIPSILPSIPNQAIVVKPQISQNLVENDPGQGGQGCQGLTVDKKQIEDELNEDERRIIRAIRQTRLGKYVQI